MSDSLIIKREITLFPHQNRLNDGVVKSWETNKNVIAVLPTGGGKSFCVADLAKKFLMRGEHCIVFAHRDVLISQLSDSLCEMDIPHTFIASKSAILDITNDQVKKFGRSFYDESSPVILSSVPTFQQRLKKGLLNQLAPLIKCWIQDECFIAGTLIDGRPIESLVEGDLVTSFNEHTNQYELKPVVRLFKNKSPDKLLKICTRSHHVLTCTYGHPFWTKRGWVNAIDLTTDDEVLIYDYSMYELQEGTCKPNESQDELLLQDSQNILQSRMCFNIFKSKSKGSTETTSTTSGLLHVRQYGRFISTPFNSLAKNAQSILQSRVFTKICSSILINNNGENQSEIRIGKDDKKQPNATCRNTFKSVNNVEGNGSQTSNTRWERQASNRSRSKIIGTIQTLWFQITNHCENWLLQRGSRLPNSLQNRLWQRKTENSNRSRWKESQHISEKRTGQKERSVSHWSRLESISIQESGNIGNTHDGFVYNIEVEGNHTYVANGVTVHNCHHHLTENIWGKCTEPLINAKGVGFTATPCRSDNKGLGRDAHGVFDDIIVGSTMSELIEIGRLSPYRIYTVPTKLDVSTVNITSSGDYNQKKLALVTDNADITGDAVEHYKRLANGKQAITFCVNIEHAEHVAQQFNDAGISSAALSSKTPLRERQHKLDQFRKGKILNLVNVNLFGEGFSVDAVCVVIMLRKTMSYGLFYQMFGRALRVMEGKEYGILLDHVGNVREHCIYGAPHDCPEWSLEPPKKKKKKSTDLKGIKSRTCPKCFGFYEPKSNNPKSFVCPYCHHSESEDEIIAAVKEIQVAEGTLTEYDCEYITGLIQRRREVDMPVEKIKAKHRFSPDVVRHSAAKNHLKRQEAQRKLRAGIAQWCKQTAETNLLDVQTTQAEFERVFGTDVFKAQTLGEREALLLLDKIHG